MRACVCVFLCAVYDCSDWISRVGLVYNVSELSGTTLSNKAWGTITGN